MEPTRNANQKVRLTKSIVDRTPLPTSGQLFLRDSDLLGFALRLTPGSKAFILEKRIDGINKRITIGRYPDLTVEQARKEAHIQLGKIATGINPIEEKHLASLQGTTLLDAFTDFKIVRKNLKASTLYDYGRLMAVAFPDWHDKPLTSITKDMVAKRHSKIGEERGGPYANLSLRFLRSLINFAMEQYETPDGESIIRINPVSRLSRTRAWFPESRRQTVIKTHELAAWAKAVLDLKEEGNSPQSTTIADYLFCLLFTGLRRQEASTLQWSQVDLKGRTLTILNTKNREPLILPLSDFLVNLFEARKKCSTSNYVFSGEGKTGYLIEPRKQMNKIMIASGITFTLHDLRRTFITTAESLDISAYAVKRLVNHKMSRDVTAGYIISDVERLRKPMQAIADYLQKCMELLPSAEVVDLAKKRKSYTNIISR
jgi:integrase